ncbi:MAG: permease-like cell division protein FtsX [Lachnospiraceae bacterium]|nr:permease-like cell division protein FtsX [Lachnospiraceae bacterium]
MRISTFFYCFRQGIKNIFKNKLFSLASVCTMSACIFLFGLFMAILFNVQKMIKDASENVCITVFFDENLSEDEIITIGEGIRTLDAVDKDKTKFVSAAEAWENFKQDYFEGHEEALDAFGDDNPLLGSASYVIYLKDITLQSDMVMYLQSLEGVRTVNQSEQLADSFSGFGKLAAYVSAAIIAVLFAVSIFLISNTVTVGITVRKEEIYIMKMIGATDFFVRFPFVVEGVVIGLLGAIIPLAIIYKVYNYLVEYVVGTFGVLSSTMKFMPINEIFKYLLPVGLVLGIGIGFLASTITVRKHVKM